MITLNLDLVKNFLLEKKFDIQFQKETNQLYMVLKVDGNDFPVFIRVYDEGDLLQLILFIPCTIKDGAQADLGRLLHTLNKEIDIPGFGMDENAKVVFYRCMIPAFNKKIEEGLLELFMQSLPLIAQSFTPVIVTAATGHATYGEIMKKMEDLQKSQQ